MKLYKPPGDGDLKEIKIELTRECLLSCVHCSSNAFSDNQIFLSKEAVFSLIDQAKQIKIKSIVFSGGEPLLWPWLTDAITYCRTKNINSTLYTTGINKTGDAINHISELISVGLNRIIFSLYSPNKQLHEEITRQVDSFDKTLTVISSLTESSITKELHFVPLSRNYQQLPSLVTLSKKLNIQRISILRFVPQGRGLALKKGHEMLNREDTLKLRHLLMPFLDDPPTKIRLGSPYNILMFNNDVECIAARHTLSIGPTGNIYPCDAFKNIEPIDIGLDDQFNNILANSLSACWYQSTYLNAVRQYLSTPFNMPCSTCISLEKCKSGCLAQKVLDQESIENGNIAKKPDPLCLKQYIGA